MKITTQDQLRRTRLALADTRRLILKERAYSVHLQKADYLASLEAHVANLEDMIREYRAN